MNAFLSLACLAATAAVFTGCAKSADSSLPEATRGGHAHAAPHGGTLLALGDHVYNLEFVRDAAAGKLVVYVLDGHAENFVRINAVSFDLIAITGGEQRTLVMRAVANSATDETVGDTSQFETGADWLKKTSQFPGIIPALNIRGAKFDHISFYLQK